MTMPLIEQIRSRAAELRALAARHHLTRVAVFGSVARGEESSESDVDLLVTGDDQLSLLDLAGFRDAAERILGRHVDVVTIGSLQPRQRDRIVRDAISL
jgi:hypothetical protein